MLEVDLPGDATLGHLKEQLQKETAVPASKMKLMGVKKGGKEAKDAATPLSECTIKVPLMMVGTPASEVMVDRAAEDRPAVLDDFQLYSENEPPGYAFGALSLVGPRVDVPLSELALVQFTSPAIRHAGDWVGLCKVRGASSIVKKRLPVGMERGVLMVAPRVAGAHEFRYFFGLNDGFVLAKSEEFHVAAPYPPGLPRFDDQPTLSVLTWNLEHVSFVNRSKSASYSAGGSGSDSGSGSGGDNGKDPPWTMEDVEPVGDVPVKSQQQFRRARGILAALRDADADVVLLQECEESLVPFLLACPWARARYHCADVRTWTTECDVRDDLGGCYILSKFPLRDMYFKELPTCQNRGALIAVLEGSNGQTLGVATVWLDSYIEDTHCRRQQMDQCVAELARYDGAVWAGDFNFDVDHPEYAVDKANIEKHTAWKDVWSSVRPGEEGITWDVDRNVRAHNECFFKPPRNLRLDRIMWRDDGAAAPLRLKPLSVDLIGRDPIGNDFPGVYPSDHYGLLANFSVICNPPPQDKDVQEKE